MTKRARAVRAALAFVIAAVLGGAGGCREATQVTLDISYGDPCARLRSVGIIATSDALAAEQRAARGEYTTVTASCTDVAGLTSRVGTISVSPGDGKTRAAITIVAGVDTPADQCRPDNRFKGCIVARRSFAFLAHSGPTFPIRLEPDCKDVPCTAETTCKKGKCVDAAAACNDDECVDKVPDGADAGGIDGGVDGADGATDGATDAPAVDAPPDGPTSGVPACPGVGFEMSQPRVCPPYTDPAPQCDRMYCHFDGPPPTFPATCTDTFTMSLFNARCTASRQCPGGQVCCFTGSNVTQCTPTCPPPPAAYVACREDCDCFGKKCLFGGTGRPPMIKFCE